jgi:opacity protein-like surface antigen
MSRWLIALVLAAGVARADDAPKSEAGGVEQETEPEPSDQVIGVSAGVAVGGRVTPGGLRLSGHYHYQLTSQDWFDGRASFTFGGGGAQCFRDRMDAVICDHGMAEGQSVELSANVRRYFSTGHYLPFARLGVGVGVVRFGDDDVTGVVFPVHVGAGLRVAITRALALSAEAELEVGFGLFNRRIGAEPQLGSSVSAGAEWRL